MMEEVNELEEWQRKAQDLAASLQQQIMARQKLESELDLAQRHATRMETAHDRLKRDASKLVTDLRKLAALPAIARRTLHLFAARNNITIDGEQSTEETSP